MLIAALLALSIAFCGPTDPDRVDASRYDSFWLWAGVAPGEALRKADTVYILDGELRGAPVRFVPLRPATPQAPNPHVWLVVRTDSLAWPDDAAAQLTARLDRWAMAGSRVEGLQVDFDASTHGLDGYAGFLERLRAALPPRYKLSITGLLDWSAHGNPVALKRLGGTIDEVVIQTYQGRDTILGYEAYFAQMKGFPLPFKVGLVEGGRWREPPGLTDEPNFRGYAVFLLNDES